MRLSKLVGNGFTMNLLFMVFIILLILKLIGTINWGWLIITLPLWGPVAAVLVFLLFFFLHTSFGGNISKK